MPCYFNPRMLWLTWQRMSRLYMCSLLLALKSWCYQRLEQLLGVQKYKITLFRDIAGEWQVCVCLYHDNFTKLVIKWLNKLYIRLEECREISWFMHQ